MNYYDYKTQPVSGSKVIDTHKTGMSFYDQFLDPNETEYLHKYKNLRGDIVMMSPEEYYEKCSKYGFAKQISVDALKRGRSTDKDNLAYLKDVLLVHKKRFPLPMINIAEHSQEGLHRMMVIGEIFGWNYKVPVLVINWFDEDRAREDAAARRQQELDWKIDRAISKTCYYTYYSIDELSAQLTSELHDALRFEDDLVIPDTVEVIEDEDEYKFKLFDREYTISKNDVIMKESNDNLDDIELDDLDYEDFLVRHFGDNWRETHPHLKNVFNLE